MLETSRWRDLARDSPGRAIAALASMSDPDRAAVRGEIPDVWTRVVNEDGDRALLLLCYLTPEERSLCPLEGVMSAWRGRAEPDPPSALFALGDLSEEARVGLREEIAGTWLLCAQMSVQEAMQAFGGMRPGERAALPADVLRTTWRETTLDHPVVGPDALFCLLDFTDEQREGISPAEVHQVWRSCFAAHPAAAFQWLDRAPPELQPALSEEDILLALQSGVQEVRIRAMLHAANRPAARTLQAPTQEDATRKPGGLDHVPEPPRARSARSR